MATPKPTVDSTGFSFANTGLGDMGADLNTVLNPYAGFSGMPRTGLDNLVPSQVDTAVLGQQLVKQSQFTMPEMKKPAIVAYSPSQRKMFVNGATFEADNDAAALQTESLLGQPGTGLPQGDWVQLDAGSYGQYLNTIKNPGLGKLAKKNFGIGIDNMQMLAGRGLQLAGAEETGQSIVDQQVKDLAKTHPYVREFSDVKDASTAIDWLVANFAQQGPNILESIATAAIGFGVGSATGGPLAGGGAALAGLAGKEAFKQSVAAAIKKRAAGEILSAVETKLLREASGIAGATAISFLNNVQTGASDIYGELRDRGADPNDVSAKMTALAGSLPYAALESLPEFLLASRLFGGGALTRGGTSTALKDIQGTSMLTTGIKRGGELLKRGAIGGVVGGGAEGTTELGQEALLVGLSGQDFSAPDVQKRLLESFAAGFGTGGIMGAAANLRRGPIGKEPTNLLNPGQTTEPSSSESIIPPAVPVGEPMQTGGMGAKPNFVAGPEGVRGAIPSDRIFTGEVAPGQFGGAQGVLDLGGATIGELQQRSNQTGELAPRMVWNPQTQQYEQQAVTAPPSDRLALPSPQAPVDSRQMALQFAPPAPSGVQFTEQQPLPNTVMAQQMQDAQRKLQLDQAFAAMAQQQAAQKQADMQRLGVQAQNQRQLDFAAQQQAAQQPQPPVMPMKQVPVRQPQQMSLFKRGELPTPSRAEGLRRGVSAQTPETPITIARPTPGEFLKAGQLSLFNQQGQPSVAALKSAGTRQQVVPTVQVGAAQIKPTGKPVTAVTATKAKAAVLKKGKANATQKGKQQQGSVSQRQEDNGRVQGGGNAGQKSTTQNKGGSNQASSSGKSLQRGKKQEKVVAAPVVTTKKETTPPTPPKSGKDKLAKGAAKKSEAKAKATPAKAAQLQKGPSGLAAMVNQLVGVRTQAPVVESKKVVGEVSAETQAENDAIDEAIETHETTKNPAAYAEALFDIVSAFALESNPRKYTRKTAENYLSDGGVPPSDFQAALKEVALNEESIGTKTRLYSLLADHGLLSDADVQAKVRTPGAKVKQAAVIDEPVNSKVTPEQRLADLINNRDGYLNKGQLNRNALILYADVDNGQFAVGERGLIDDFFDEDGDPIIVQIPGTNRYVLATQAESEVSTEDYAKRHAEARQALRELEDEESQTTLDDLQYDPLYDNARSDRGDLEFFRVDGKPAAPMKTGALKLVVARAISKYARKPKVAVFANLADMKASNPTLFKAAAQARKAGDIEHVNAAGMAWGDNVVLFADFIESEHQARFIVAHETLGHVGFRGLINGRALDAVLQQLADNDEQLKHAAEVYAAGRNIPFTEAVEEVLADRAAAIETNTLIRFWNWIKNQLNKLGFTFNDDAARFLIGLSRQYIRKGTGRSEFNLSGIYKDINAALQNELSSVEVLRYSSYAPQGQATFALGNLNRNAAIHGGMERVFTHIIEAKNKFDAARTQGTGMKMNAGNIMQKVFDGIKTQDNLARESKGLAKIFAKIQDKASMQTVLKTRYAEGTKTAHGAPFLGFGEGPLPEELTRAGELMAYASIYKMRQYSDSDLDKFTNPVFYDYEAKLQSEAFDELKAAGLITPEEFQKGFKVQQGTVEKNMTPEEQQRLGAERDKQVAYLENAKARALARHDKNTATAEDEDAKAEEAVKRRRTEKSYDADIKATKTEYTKRINAPSYEAANMVDISTIPELAWMKEITADSKEYKIYKEFFDTMAISHIDVLRSKYIGAVHEQNRLITDGVSRAFKTPLTTAERKFLDDVTARYEEMRMQDSEMKNNRLTLSEAAQSDALKFLRNKFARAFYNDLALNDFKSMVKGYTAVEVDNLVRSMRAKLRRQIDPDVDRTENSSIWALEHNMEEISMFTSSINDDQMYAKRSIAGSYVPLTRQGEWQVRLQAFATNSKGEEVPIKLRQGEQDSLPFYKTPTEKDAADYQQELNTVLNGEYEMRDEDGNVANVRLRAIRSVTEQTPELVDIMHYDEVMYSLSKLGLHLKPEQREVLVKKVTAQNSRARSNLQRAAVPGWDKDVVRGASGFLEQQAYTAANKQFRHQFDSILDDNRNWFGDSERLSELKAKWENSTGSAKEIAARDYFQEKFYYDKSNATDKSGKSNRGNYYKERGKSLLDWLDSTGDIVHADDIWTNNEWSVAARTWAAVAQLGGSIATGITQMISLPTNSWAYLASFNPKTGFGVGLGAGKAGYLLTSYGVKAANIKYAKADYIAEQLAIAESNDSGVDSNGLTASELRFLKDLSEEQRLDAAQFNALTGTVRGKQGAMGNATFQKFVQVWMTPFSYSEQFNRRVTVLAAYRGEYDRQIAAGVDVSLADQAARTMATKALDATQGDYAQYTRPAFFRGGLQSFIYMYKQYPIIMVQLLKNMDYKGRIIMLGSLILLSGLRGLPGSDDLLDIVDGLCQRLGLRVGSVEKEFVRITREVFGKELAEELNPILMRGLLDHVTGWSFSNRIGLGDIIPGTGLLKPSATKQELLREVENLAGAPTSFIAGVLNWTGGTLPAVLSGRQSPLELLRDSPVRAFKNLGDAWQFHNSGAIVDSKGYVVAKNATNWEILGKAMGFYPSRAQVQMDWMAADTQEQAYASMIKTEALREAVVAKLEGDTDKQTRVKNYIAEWNEASKGTRLEIRNFDKSVQNAYKEAKQPLALRSLKSSARGGRAEAKDMLRAYGVDEEVLQGIPD